MRKIILLFYILFLAEIGQAQSSVYHPFPEGDAVWTEVSAFNGSGVGCSVYQVSDCSYFQRGDTVISGISYNKVYRNEHAYGTNTGPSGPVLCDETSSFGEFYGGLRNDVAAKQVFLYTAWNQAERLLYDFNLEPGDSLDIGVFVTSVDSILIGSNYRKRINLNSNAGGFADTSIIEGIGSLSGLIPVYYYFENFDQLICFSESGPGLSSYTNPNAVKSCVTVGLSEEEIERNVLIYPQPGKHEITIQTENLLQDAAISIIDALGKEVLRIPHQSGADFSLDCDQLRDGIYVLRIDEKTNLVLHSKIVIGSN